LPVIDIVAAVGAEAIASARELFLEYAAALPVDLEYQGFAAELENLPGAYRPPAGALLLARVDGALAGCVAVRPLDTHVGEMKRLYVRRLHRGSGVGPRLVEAAIAAAGACGYAALWLDTLASMTAAQRLYQRYGFRTIAPYGGQAAPGTRYYGLRLPAAREPA
jgi:putative acetyltransferase